MKQPIRILDFGFNLLCEIENYQSLSFVRNYTSFGNFELIVSKYSLGAQFLKKGNLVYLSSNKVGIIKHRELTIGAGGKADENILIKGYTLEHLLTQRITDVPAGQSHWTFSGAAETGIKSMIDYNISVNANKPERIIGELLIAEDFGRGPNIELAVRYGKLDEEVAKALELAKMGVRFSVDYKLKKIIIDLYDGKYRTSGQFILPPVIFSVDYGNVSSQKLIDSRLNYKTNAIVGGQGEGADRAIVNVSKNSEVFAGINRCEIFVDARDISPDSNVTLEQRGLQKLSEFNEVLTVEGAVIPTNTFIFEKDYFLGDIVTLKVEDVDSIAILDSRITQVGEFWDESGYNVSVVFGNKVPNLIDKIKNNIESGLSYRL